MTGRQARPLRILSSESFFSPRRGLRAKFALLIHAPPRRRQLCSPGPVRRKRLLARRPSAETSPATARLAWQVAWPITASLDRPAAAAGSQTRISREPRPGPRLRPSSATLRTAAPHHPPLAARLSPCAQAARRCAPARPKLAGPGSGAA